LAVSTHEVTEILNGAFSERFCINVCSEQASQSPNRALDFEIPCCRSTSIRFTCNAIDVRWKNKGAGLFWTVLFVLQLNEDIFNMESRVTLLVE